MAVSTNLYQLIKSMTKAEKAYFKKFSYKTTKEENHIYFTLFDAIDRQKDYQEEKLLKKFRYHKITQNFSITKNYLFKLILKSLRAYNSQKIIEDIVLDNIREIRILLNKGLYKEGLSRIRKTKIKAENHQLQLYQLQLLQLENQALRLNNDIKKIGEHLALNLERENKIIVNYKKELEYEQINFKIIHLLATIGTPKKPQDVALYKILMTSPLLQNETLPQNYRIKTIYHGLRSILYAIQDDPTSAYVEGKTLIKLIEEHFELSLKQPNSYIYVLNNFIINCFTLKKYKDCLKHIALLKNLPNRSFLYETPLYQALIFDITTNNELEVWILMGQFEKGIEARKAIMLNLEKYGQLIEVYGVIHIYYLLAVCHFAVGLYHEAQQLLQTIFNNYPKARTSALIEAKILNLLVLFELKEDKLLTHYLTATYRYLSKLKHLKTFDQLTVKYIEKAMHQPYNKAILATFIQLHEALEQAVDVSQKANMTHHLVLMTWLRSKIKKQTFKESFEVLNGVDF